MTVVLWSSFFFTTDRFSFLHFLLPRFLLRPARSTLSAVVCRLCEIIGRRNILDDRSTGRKMRNAWPGNGPVNACISSMKNHTFNASGVGSITLRFTTGRRFSSIESSISKINISGNLRRESRRSKLWKILFKHSTSHEGSVRIFYNSFKDSSGDLLFSSSRLVDTSLRGLVFFSSFS